MNLKVLGPRILIKVKKYKKEEVIEKKKYVEGSNLILAPDIDNLDHATDLTTVNQCVGEVVQIGNTAYSSFDQPWVKVGDFIHFTRYGAVRLRLQKDDPDFEYWVLMEKDPLLIEERIIKTEKEKSEV